MGHHNRMSEVERNHAVALYERHRSIQKVAAILGRTKEPIRRLLHRRGVPVASSAEVQARTRGPSTMQHVPPVQPEQLDRVCEAGQRYVAWREQRRELQRQEYGLPPDGQSL